MKLVLRGRSASILWGHRPAATVSSWRVWKQRTKAGQVWRLSATVDRASAFDLRQSPLLFAAPRQGGFFLWPLVGAPRLEQKSLSAELGPPEH
jgi:hypothetical protein